MFWWKRIKPDHCFSDPLLRLAKQARDEAARMPFGAAKAALLTKAETSELTVIEQWLSPLKSLKR